MAHADPNLDFESLLRTMKGMDEVERKKYYKKMAVKLHPDKVGKGSEGAMSDLNRAFDRAENVDSDVTAAAQTGPNGENETDDSAAPTAGGGEIQVGEKLSDIFRNAAEQAAENHMSKTKTWDEMRRSHVIPHTTAAASFLRNGARGQQAAAKSTAASSGRIRCPKCVKEFTQPVDLETHFYDEHQDLEKLLQGVTPLAPPSIPSGQGGFPAGALSVLAVTTAVTQDPALMQIAQQQCHQSQPAVVPLVDDVKDLNWAAGGGGFSSRASLLEGWKADGRSKKVTHALLPGVELTPTVIPEATGAAVCGICKSSMWKGFRHHCRSCGMWVCGEDSKTTSAIPQSGHTSAVRVCGKCGKDELASKLAQAVIPQVGAKVAYSVLSFATHFAAEIAQAGAAANPVLRFALHHLGKAPPASTGPPSLAELRTAAAGTLSRDQWLSVLRARATAFSIPKDEFMLILKDLPLGSALAFEILNKFAVSRGTPVPKVLLELCSSDPSLIPKIGAFLRSGRIATGLGEMMSDPQKLPAAILEVLIPIANRESGQTPCQYYQELLRKGVTKEVAFKWLAANQAVGLSVVQDCCSSEALVPEAFALLSAQKPSNNDLDRLAQTSSNAAKIVNSYLIGTASAAGVTPPAGASLGDVYTLLPQLLTVSGSNLLKERIQMVFAHGFAEENLALMMAAADAWMQSGFQPSMVAALCDLGGVPNIELQRSISDAVPPTVVCTLELALLKTKKGTEQGMNLHLCLAECYLAADKSDSALSATGIIFPQISTASGLAKKRFVDILHAVVEQHEAAQVDSTMPYLKLQVLSLAERLGQPLTPGQTAERRKLTSDKATRKQQKKVDPPHVVKVKTAAATNQLGAILGAKSVLAPVLAEVFDEDGYAALSEVCAAIRQDVPAVEAILTSLGTERSAAPNVVLTHAFKSWAGGYDLVREFWTYVVCSDRFIKEVLTMVAGAFDTMTHTGTLSATFLAHDPSAFPLPAVTKHQQFYRDPSVIAFARCERATLRSLHAGLEALRLNAAGDEEAMADHYWEHSMRFVDLLAAAPNGSSRVGILLRAAECISGSITSWRRMPRPRLCGAKSVLNELSGLIFNIADRISIPDRIFAAQSVLSLMVHTNTAVASTGAKLFDESDAGIVTTSVEKLTLLTPLWPVLALRPVHACDLIYTQSLEEGMFETILASSQLQERKVFPIQDREKTYHLLCGAYHGWIRDKLSAPTLDEARALAVSTQLKSSRWSARDVEANVQLTNVPRDESGFLDPRRRSELKGAGNGALKYHAIHGVKIDTATGALTLDLEHATYGKPGLFNDADIGDIFSRGLVGGIFTLDAPPQWQSFGTELPPVHPFQQIGFSPSTLQNSVLLAEMMYTDYLLKFFTTGTEVSGKAPFPTRPTTALLAQLPRDMQEVLSPIEGSGSAGKAHRFWISAGDIPVQKGVQSGTYSFKFGQVEMCVKTQLLRRTPNGDVEDAPIADQRDDSKEAEFARRFSRNYNRVAAEFPVFARLRELYKICGAFTRIHQIAEGMREDRRTEITNNVQPKVKEGIDDLLRQVGSFPKPLPRNDVETIYGKLLSDQGVSRHQVPSHQESDLKSKIRSQIREAEADAQRAEDQAVNKVRDIFNGMSGKSTFDAYDTRRILERRTSSSAAARTVALEIADKHHQEAQRACRNIQSTGIATSIATPGEMVHEPRGSNSCPWVPASFGKTTIGDHVRLVYGGVSAVVSFTDARINPPTTSPMRLSTNQLNSQRTIGAAHSDAARIDNMQVNNARFFAQQQQQSQMMANMRQQQQQARANLPVLASGGGSCYGGGGGAGGGGGGGGSGGGGGGGGGGSGGAPPPPPSNHVHNILSTFSSVTGKENVQLRQNDKDVFGKYVIQKATSTTLKEELIMKSALSHPNPDTIESDIRAHPQIPQGTKGINKMGVTVQDGQGKNYEVHWAQYQGRRYDVKLKYIEHREVPRE